MTELLAQFDLYKFFVILHIVGTAIAVGGATLSDLLFFRSIEDGRISKQEFRLMHTGGIAIWGGLAIVILSGAGLVGYQYFVEGNNLLVTSTKLQAKLVIVSIIGLNGLLLHTRIFPLFKQSLEKDITKELFVKHASLIFTSGAVSFVSWYSAMIIGAWRQLSAPTIAILAVYFTILTCGVIVANIVGRYKVKKISEKLGGDADQTPTVLPSQQTQNQATQSPPQMQQIQTSPSQTQAPPSQAPSQSQQTQPQQSQIQNQTTDSLVEN